MGMALHRAARKGFVMLQGVELLLKHECGETCYERWPVQENGFRTPYVPQPVKPESYASIMLAIDADIEQAENELMWSVVRHLLQYKLFVIDEYMAVMSNGDRGD